LGIVKTLSSGNAFATARSIVNSASAGLDSIAGSMKKYGSLVKGVSTALSGTASLVIDAFEKAYGTFEKLSSVGAVSTFEDMRHSANAMELNFTQYNDFLSKHSKDLALWGGSVIAGRKEFEKLAADSYYARTDFQKLGISTDEFTEFQANYIEQQLRIGRGQSIVTDDLNDETQSYILQVDALSKLYGQSRQSIAEQRKKRLEEVGFAVFLRGLTVDQQKSTNLFLDILGGETQSEEFTAGTQKLLQNGFRAVDEQTQQINNVLVQQGKLDINETRKLLSTGVEQDALKAAQLVVDAMRRVNVQATSAAQLFGTNNFVSSQYAAILNVQSRGEHNILEEYNARIAEDKKTQEDQKSQNATLADSIQNIEAAKRNVDQMATSSKIATTALDEMTEAIDAFAEQILTDSNQKLPPDLQAKKELRQATAKSKRAKEDYESALSGEKTDVFGRALPDWVIKDMKKQAEEAQAKETAARVKLNDVMATTKKSAEPQTDEQRVAEFTKGFENSITHFKGGGVGTGINAFVAGQEEQYPQAVPGSKYAIPSAPKMNIGGSITDFTLSDGNENQNFSETSTQNIGTRSLNTSFITNGAQDTIDFNKVYNEVSV